MSLYVSNDHGREILIDDDGGGGDEKDCETYYENKNLYEMTIEAYYFDLHVSLY